VVLGAVGAASAETELFSGETTLPSGTRIEVSMETGSSALMSSTSGGLVNTCVEGSAEGKTNITTGAVVSGTGNVIALGQCSFTTDTVANGNFSVTRIAGTNDGTVASNGTVATVGIAGATCLYGTGNGTHLGTLDGVTTGHATLPIKATINEQEPKKILCPDTTVLSMGVVVTSPTGLNIGS
jgi:hypothetical protein